MNLRKTVKTLLGIGSVDVAELNRRATLEHERSKLEAVGSDPLDEIVITDEYERVRALIEASSPVVFVTGNAGTGKSTLIRYLRNVLDLRLAVVAPTGVAALNVGGVTIHSLFHLPPKIHEEADIKRVYDRKLYQKLQLLVIDEVSMVRCDLIDSIDRFLRKNRSSKEPFGGVQLLLIGDLFQLPPVAPKQEWDVLRAKGYTSPYFFSSFSLQKTSLVYVELTVTYRQEDRNFVDLLNRTRIADDIDFLIRELNGRCWQQDGSSADIILTSTNNGADQINRGRLHGLPSNEFSFKGRIEGKFNIEETRLPSPFDLRLKVGAHVMFTKNDEQKRWVNGTLGVISKIEQNAIRVELVSDSRGMKRDVLPVTWEKYKYAYDQEEDSIVARVEGQYTQYPLMLAWAVTIHKSQGKTLDSVLIDLGSGAFDFGQAYVALSRCRSIEGIQLARPIQKSDVKCDPIVKRFYFALAEMSRDTRDQSTNATDALQSATDR